MTWQSCYLHLVYISAFAPRLLPESLIARYVVMLRHLFPVCPMFQHDVARIVARFPDAPPEDTDDGAALVVHSLLRQTRMTKRLYETIERILVEHDLLTPVYDIVVARALAAGDCVELPHRVSEPRATEAETLDLIEWRLTCTA